MRKSSKKRLAILNAAIKLFSRHGYKGCTVQKIADYSNVSKGTIYTYFNCKKQLLTEVFNFGFSNLEKPLLSISKKTIGLNRLESLIKLHLANVKENVPFWKLYFQLMPQSDLTTDFEKIFQRKISRMIEEYSIIFNYLNYPNYDTLAHLLVAEIQGISMFYIICDGNYPIEFIEKEMINKYKNEKSH